MRGQGEAEGMVHWIIFFFAAIIIVAVIAWFAVSKLGAFG
jgi:hypothetical protein